MKKHLVVIAPIVIILILALGAVTVYAVPGDESSTPQYEESYDESSSANASSPEESNGQNSEKIENEALQLYEDARQKYLEAEQYANEAEQSFNNANEAAMDSSQTYNDAIDKFSSAELAYEESIQVNEGEKVKALIFVIASCFLHLLAIVILAIMIKKYCGIKKNLDSQLAQTQPEYPDIESKFIEIERNICSLFEGADQNNAEIHSKINELSNSLNEQAKKVREIREIRNYVATIQRLPAQVNAPDPYQEILNKVDDLHNIGDKRQWVNRITDSFGNLRHIVMSNSGSLVLSDSYNNINERIVIAIPIPNQSSAYYVVPYPGDCINCGDFYDGLSVARPKISNFAEIYVEGQFVRRITKGKFA